MPTPYTPASEPATLHLEAGQLDHGLHHARHALDTATSIRSAQLAGHLTPLRTAAAAHPHEPELATLTTDIDTATTRTHRNPGGRTVEPSRAALAATRLMRSLALRS